LKHSLPPGEELQIIHAMREFFKKHWPEAFAVFCIFCVMLTVLLQEGFPEYWWDTIKKFLDSTFLQTVAIIITVIAAIKGIDKQHKNNIDLLKAQTKEKEIAYLSKIATSLAINQLRCKLMLTLSELLMEKPISQRDFRTFKSHLAVDDIFNSYWRRQVESAEMFDIQLSGYLARCMHQLDMISNIVERNEITDAQSNNLSRRFKLFITLSGQALMLLEERGAIITEGYPIKIHSPSPSI